MPQTSSVHTPVHVSEKKSQSNYETILYHIIEFPGLRFHELKKEVSIANGTLQHHISSLVKSGIISVQYDNSTPRYFSNKIKSDSQIIIKRLSQITPSKIIKLLLKKECQTFAQLVKYSKKSPGTVSLYKNKLVADRIIIGTTDGCKSCKNRGIMKIKYRLVEPEKVRALVLEYGKSSLSKSADNLADIFLSLR
jgi:predicted transcriptional regulator